MKRSLLPAILLVVIAIVQFHISNYFFKGYLRSETFLAKEIKTPLTKIEEYKIVEEPPFKYRILFPALVKGTHAVVFDGDTDRFFTSYWLLSLLFYVTSALSLYALLIVCGFSETYSFAGGLIFLLLPAMLFAFTLPVHSREDTLAYTLLFLGLNALITRKRILFLGLCILGVLVRETLLLLPLLYLLFAKDENIPRRLFIGIAPAICWICLRIFMRPESYDMWQGLRWNVNNVEQVIGFSFITFNVLWLPFILHVWFYRRHLNYTASDLRFFYRSSVFTLAIVFVTTFLGGIFNEIRLLYLFAPWMIVISLNFWKNYSSCIISSIQTRWFAAYSLFLVTLCAGILVVTLDHRETLIPPGRFAVPYDQWVFAAIVYLLFFLASIPLAFKVYQLKKAPR
jgi:hypothetical protein